MKYAVYLEKDAGSDYGVTIPDIHGCFSAGSTIEEAFENAQEAILTHIEGLLMDNETIPYPSPIEELKENLPGAGILWGLVSVDLAKLSRKVKRINITLPEHILSKIDACARREGETRSGFLATAVLDHISRQDIPGQT